LMEALNSTTEDLSVDEMVGLVLKAGEVSVNTMALLDKANTTTYGNPEITEVNLGVRNNPGILISGHDLKDMEELLKQTEGTGVDVYTHGEMLPCHYYPELKKYDHLVGNYGGSWWHQNQEFQSFNGPILMTTNCVIPLKKDNTYLDRLFTTGVVGFVDANHIPERAAGGKKDFSAIIAKAKQCASPTEIETGKIVGGFAHNQVLALADKVVAAVKSGAIKRFVVMAGCDGRQKGRAYFTEVAENLPKDTIILTAGCAKYRYNKLNLGDIGGIPRVLDAGQCNDSYSLAVIALKLKEVAYIHAEGYPAGELKHGPLALVDEDMPVVAIAPGNDLLEKVRSNLQEVRARGGRLYVFTDAAAGFSSSDDVSVIELPSIHQVLAPITYAIPLQLLAYHVAVLRGTDVDQPRNLAKSVTVE